VVSIDWHPLFPAADLTVADILDAATSGGDVQDQFDVTLEDSDLLGEVELTTNLIIAASESEEPLSTAQIDAILGVGPGHDGS